MKTPLGPFSQKLPAVLPPAIFFSVVCLGWELLCRVQWIPPYLAASPSEIAQCLVLEWRALLPPLVETSAGALGGFVLSCVVGLGAAVFLTRWNWAFRALYPFAVVFQTVPIIAVAPLLVIWLGYGLPTVVASAALASLFPVLLAGLEGFRTPQTDLTELFRLYRASWWATFRKLVLPLSLRVLATGLRVAAGLAVIGAVVGEFVGGGGLGGVVDVARTQQRLDLVFAAVFLTCSLGALAVAGVDMVSLALMRRWSPKEV